MASYQARQRDRLFDSATQAALERRGQELTGIILLVLALLFALLLASYSPEDPSWLSATDEQVVNLLGRLGASIASPVIVIVGLGGWGIPVLLAVWGARFVAHRGGVGAIGRLIFAPIAIAFASVYISTHVPGGTWTHSFGLGGLFGDTVLGAILGVLPVNVALGLKIMSVATAIGTAVMAAVVLGFTRAELVRTARFLIFGVVMVYAGVLRLLGMCAAGSVAVARKLQARRHEKLHQKRLTDEELQAERMISEPSLAQPVVRRPITGEARPVAPLRAEPTVTAPVSDLPEQKPGLLSRLLKRTPETEPQFYTADDFGNPEIKAKIAQVIKNRVTKRTLLHSQPEPVLNARHPRGPTPMILQNTQPILPGDDIPEPTVEPAVYQPSVAPMPDAKNVVQHPPRRVVQPSRQARAEAQPKLQFEEPAPVYELPPLSLLADPVVVERHHLSDEALEENARMLESVLDDYGVKGEIVSVRPGPVVTMYELEPAPGLKASRVIGLADDIARSMSALSARVSTVPGRSVIGIELPNEHREKVMLREILANRGFGDGNQQLPIALGKDISGDAMIVNLAKMPHLLIAGTTGSGKSVAINTMILSLLYKLTPDECRMIMIDPKMLELSVYDGIPHLLSPVVTDPKKAVVALKWVVGEMEERYRKMSKMGVRNIDGYNGRVDETLAKNEMFSRTVQTGFDDATGEPVFETEEFAPERMPYIVVIVDEMADLMMVAGKEIEACIQRLAQMARASGIHLIMATQRPSVDVITGTIKANFPTRISFQVTSKIDSRTILGEMGAEQLLGMGDMLYMAGGGKITRCHGPFVSDEEVEEVVNNLKAYGPPDYVSHVVAGPPEDKASSIDAVLGLGGNTNGEDALYDSAVQIVLTDRKCSTSYIQRKLAIGYNKAARLVEQMEDERIVSTANHVGKREILGPEQ